MSGLPVFLLLTILIANIAFTNSINGQTIFKNSESVSSSWVTDSNQIKFIKNYSKIASVSELLNSFNGKPVFIDLWTTWCSPCLKEFKFSRPLYDYLTKNGIEIIYVSFDKDSEDSLWRNKVNENKLLGYHIRANKQLQDSLTTLIWGGIDAYSIPRYLLYNKNKKLVNMDTSPPSSGLKLFEEIELDLK